MGYLRLAPAAATCSGERFRQAPEQNFGGRLIECTRVNTLPHVGQVAVVLTLGTLPALGVVQISWTTPKTWAVGDPGTASDLNQFIRDNSAFLYGDTGWTAPTLINSWVNAGGTSQTVGYRKVGTRVIIRGAAKTGTIGSVVFVLPTGYRPTANESFATSSNGAFGSLTIDTSGNVTAVVGSSSGYWLGCSFDTI